MDQTLNDLAGANTEVALNPPEEEELPTRDTALKSAIDASTNVPMDFPDQGLPQGMGKAMEEELVRPSVEEARQRQDEQNKWHRESLETIHGGLTDFDNFNPDKSEELRQRQLISALIDVKYDTRPESPLEYKTARSRLADDFFDGKGRDSDDVLFSQMQGAAQERQKSQDVEKSLLESARINLMGGDVHTFSHWAEGQPTMSEPRKASHFLRWKEEQDATNEVYGSMLRHVRKTYGLMQKGDEWLDYAGAAYEDADEDDRELFLDGLNEISALHPTPQLKKLLLDMGVNPVAAAGAQLGENVGKAGRGVANAAKAGVVGTEDFVMSGETYGFARFFGSNEAVAREKENTRKDKAFAASKRKYRDFLADVRNVFEGTYDPIRPVSQKDSKLWHIETGMYQIPAAMTTTAMAWIPGAGGTLMTGAIYEMGRQNYRQEFIASGMERERAAEMADVLATVATPFNALIERAQAFAWAGSVPGFDKVIQKVNNKVSNRFARGAVKWAIANAAETSEELAQEIVDNLVQDYAHAWEEEIPDVEWKNGKDGVFDGYFNKIISTWTTVSPLGVSVAVGGFNADKRAEAFRQTPRIVRKAWGITEHDNDSIDNAKNPQELLEAVQAGITNHDGYSELAKDATQEIAEEAERQREAVREAQRAGEFPFFRLSKQSGAIDAINPQTGESLGVAEDGATATEIAYTFMEMRTSESQDKFDEIAWLLESTKLDMEEATDPDAKAEVSPLDFMTPTRMGLENPEMTEEISSSLERLEQLNGGTGEVSKLVYGMSFAQHEEDQTSYLQKLWGGASAFTLTHERGHAKFRQALDSGAMNLDESWGFFQELDKVLEGKVDKNGDSLRFIPKEATEPTFKLVDEAVAELTRCFCS